MFCYFHNSYNKIIKRLTIQFHIVIIQTQMKEVYILLPLLQTNMHSIESQIQKILNLKRESFTIHDISDDKIAVEIDNFGIGYEELRQMLEEIQGNRNKLNIIEETLKVFQFSSTENSSISPQSIDSLVKKAQKYKDVKEENKKLRKLLQNQLENTQKVRDQTQKTMKILREEFDALVMEMNRSNAQRQSNNPSVNSFPRKQGGGPRIIHQNISK